jgi:hypothetical protein
LKKIYIITSVPDPDPRVFLPPRSGPLVRVDPALDQDPSIIMLKNKKNLESYYFVTLFDFIFLKNNVNLPSKSNKQKNFVKKLVFCWHREGQFNDENSRRHGSADPDPHLNVMDPEH